MKAEITRVAKLASECAPHTICIGVKLIVETKEDEEMIKSIRELPEGKNWLVEVGSYELSCDGHELEIEISF